MRLSVLCVAFVAALSMAMGPGDPSVYQTGNFTTPAGAELLVEWRESDASNGGARFYSIHIRAESHPDGWLDGSEWAEIQTWDDDALDYWATNAVTEIRWSSFRGGWYNGTPSEQGTWDMLEANAGLTDVVYQGDVIDQMPTMNLVIVDRNHDADADLVENHLNVVTSQLLSLVFRLPQ